jgi:hypothetical protein
VTTIQTIACTIAWTAAAVACWALVSLRRTARELRAARRTFPVGGGEVTVTAPMSDADYEDLKARWMERYSKPGTVNHEPTEEQP